MRPNQMNVFEIKVYFSYNIVRILLESAKNGYYALVAPGALIGWMVLHLVVILENYTQNV